MPRDVRICFIGDSYVAGVGDESGLGWTGRVASTLRSAGLDCTAYALGIRRDTSADIRERWQSEACRRLPASCEGRLVFSFGVNDCILAGERTRLALSDSLENARQILAAARGWLPTLVVGPPAVALSGQGPINERIALLSGMLHELCVTRSLPYIDLFTPLFQNQAWLADLARDGAHPSAAGYARMAQLILAQAAWQAWIAAPPTV